MKVTKNYQIFLLVFFFIFLFSACERKSTENQNTKKEHYNNTLWLEMHGEISKGYHPYLEVHYLTYLDECRIKKYKNIFDHIFMYIITRIVPVENALYEPRIKNKIYKANLSENGKFYSIKYPNNFVVDGCRFDINSALLEVTDTDSKFNRYENNQTFNTTVLRYYFIDPKNDFSDREHNLTGDYYCKFDAKFNKTLCSKYENKYQDNYYFLRSLYSINELYNERNSTVNIYIMKNTK